jgi:tryptophan synthase beta chain
MRDWVNVRSTHYVLGTAYGSHPYPMMVRDFHRIIGDETRRQVLQRERTAARPAHRLRGWWKHAIGLFYPFLGDESVKMIGSRLAAKGLCADATRPVFKRETGRIAGREDLAAGE